MRHILNLELICFNNNLCDPEIDCEDSSAETGQIIYLMVDSLTYANCFILMARVSTNPCGRFRSTVNKVAIFAYLYSIVVTVFLTEKMRSIVIALPPVMGIMIGPVLDRRNFNKGGLVFGAIVCLVQFLAVRGTMFVAKGVREEFLFDLPYAVFVPFAVQAAQGLVIMASEKLSDSCRFSAWNQDTFILLAKYQLMVISSLKFVVLLGVLENDNFIIIAAINIVMDAVGRIQFWEYLFRRIYSKITGQPPKMSMSKLSEILLCSEIDMDYFPWIATVAMNVTMSPLKSSTWGVNHTKNSYLELRSDSLMIQSWPNLLTLLSIIVIGDIFTIILYKFASRCRCRMYRIRYIFAKSTGLCILFGMSFVRIILSPILGFGYMVTL